MMCVLHARLIFSAVVVINCTKTTTNYLQASPSFNLSSLLEPLSDLSGRTRLKTIPDVFWLVFMQYFVTNSEEFG